MNLGEIKITINAPELSTAIMALAQALTTQSTSKSDLPSEPVPPVVNQSPTPIPPVVPTSAPTYTFEELARAGANLASTSPEKRTEIVSLLNNHFKITALNELKPEQYGEYAAALRSMGASI